MVLVEAGAGSENTMNWNGFSSITVISVSNSSNCQSLCLSI